MKKFKYYIIDKVANMIVFSTSSYKIYKEVKKEYELDKKRYEFKEVLE